jgi:hypothetical protein
VWRKAEVAMAKARQQARRKGKWREKRTPQPKEQEEKVPIIGSSCTWRDAELGQFNVSVNRDVNVREMIPEKFFHFDHLPDYIDCIILVWLMLMAGKKELCALSEEDLMKEEVVNRIRNKSGLMFQSLREVFSIQPELRRLNTSRKRKQINSQSSQVPPISLQASDLPPVIEVPKSNQRSQGNACYGNSAILTIVITSEVQIEQIVLETPSTSTRRIVSDASIADPNQDSAGGARIWGSTEKASDLFASNFMNYIIGWIWPSGIELDWVRGREGPTVLTWTSSYYPLFFRLIILVPKRPFW